MKQRPIYYSLAVFRISEEEWKSAKWAIPRGFKVFGLCHNLRSNLETEGKPNEARLAQGGECET